MSSEDSASVSADLWRFSLAVYKRDGVEEACLLLQDRFDADVNLLLLICWLTKSGRRVLLPGELKALINAAQPWQDGVIGPLRQLRRQLKDVGTPEGELIYQSLKRSELDAERAEQMVLCRLARTFGCLDRVAPEGFTRPVSGASAMDAARLSLEGYFNQLKVELDRHGRRAVARLLAAALPDASGRRPKRRPSRPSG